MGLTFHLSKITQNFFIILTYCFEPTILLIVDFNS